MSPRATGEPIVTRELKPEPVRVTIEGLPAPSEKASVDRKPEIAPLPVEGTLYAPKGFHISVHAEGMKKARWMALTPEGDLLLSQGRENRISILRDTNGDGSIDQTTVFADESNGLDLPMGMAFVEDFLLIGNTGEVRRYPWRKGQLKLEGKGERITELPGKGYNQHWTRNVVASPDGKWVFISVGSASNVDVEEAPRASVLRMRPDGSDRSVFASGLRNPVGLAFHPGTGELYTTVNERDRLGDDLVPDYFTRLREGGFYGWPYAYLAPDRLDPRRMRDGRSERPDLAEKTLTPDLLFQAHSAALGLTFASGTQFPQKYRHGAFVALRGSWNRNTGTGYKIVFIPFKADGRPQNYYEDFVTGFLTEPEVPRTWGRPVGTLMQPDGSLLFTEEENGRIYRVNFTGEP